MRPASLCPDPSFWRVRWVVVEGEKIVLYLKPVRAGVPCPLCGVSSQRVHSFYQRKALDLPWFSWPVQLVIRARRFFCDNSECGRQIFTEPFPEVLGRYARQTDRAQSTLLELAHCSSAELAARVARLLGFITSPDTLLRLQRRENFPYFSPRILGVDEFALRKGRTYGTLVVDLERRCPVDLFEGISAQDLTQWLRGHSQVEVLARDRAWAYRLAGHTALPEAQQVADRFHLVHNVGNALKDFLHSQRWNITEAPAGPAGAPKQAKPTETMRARWEAIQQRKGSEQSVSAIGRELSINRKTVSKYLASDRPPVYAGRPPGPSKVRPYLPYLRQRWIEGCHNARALYHEIVQQGYDGAERHIRKAVHPWRSAQGPPVKSSPPLNWLVLRPYQGLTCSDKGKLDDFLRAHPLLAQGHKLKEWFHQIIRQGDIEAFDAWVREAAESGLKQFRSTARSFRQDYEAIKLALTTPWSTGQCEGQICRVKMIKRMGYGRAKPDLLRQRVLHRLAA